MANSEEIYKITLSGSQLKFIIDAIFAHQDKTYSDAEGQLPQYMKESTKMLALLQGATAIFQEFRALMPTCISCIFHNKCEQYQFTFCNLLDLILQNYLGGA